MSILDAILIVAIIYLTFLSGKHGFVKSVGMLISVVLGAFFAGSYFEQAASWVGSGNFAKVVAFLFIFLLVHRLVKLIIWLLDKAVDLLSVIPLTKSFNRLLGAVFGFISSILSLGLVLTLLSQYSINPELDKQIAESLAVKVLIFASKILVPLLPRI